LDNHLLEIEKLIKQTRRGSCAVVKKLDDAVTVVIHNYARALSLLPNNIEKNNLQEAYDDFSKYLDVKMPEFPDREKVLTLTNLEHFNQKRGEFMRLVAPYSVYPFSAKTCTELMCGKILITTFVDLNALKEAFIKDSWSVEEVDYRLLGKEIKSLKADKKASLERYKIICDDTLFKLTKNGIIVHLPFSIVLRMGYEFLTTQTIINFANKIPAIQLNDKDTYGSIVQFTNESEIWK
jgi:hypothetical protein